MTTQGGTQIVSRLGFLVGALIASAAPVAAVAIGDAGKQNNKTFEYAVGLWGDLPYSDAQAGAVPALIADINNSEIEFSVNDGDLKAGGTRCDDVVYTQVCVGFGSD